MSAQELLQIFPDLVLDGQDGYLGVNYVEMVPLLLRSIQELKQKVDELESEDMAMSGSTTSVSSAELTSNVLYQNSPNPCKQQTTIRFSLEANVSNAALCIFDMSGKLVMKLPISPSMENVTIDANDLSEGIYLYSLVVNGKEVNSKRMIVIK